jgi:hypothetical protein
MAGEEGEEAAIFTAQIAAVLDALEKLASS